MAFPWDELVEPKLLNLIGGKAPRVGTDYFCDLDLDLGAADTYDMGEMTIVRATLKKRREDTTAIAIASTVLGEGNGSITISNPTLGYVEFRWDEGDLTDDDAGACWWSLEGGNSNGIIPLIEGKVDLKKFA